jgi:prepilin-type N-terminal cleavage/methylation domain-containing protein
MRHRKQPLPAPGARAGFTLLEMLVAIGIIVIVAALSLGVIAAVMASQKSKAAEQTLDKVASLLEHQWKAVIDQSRSEFRQGKVHPSLMTAAGGNTDKAQTLWTQLRLQQEFPVNFQEATSSSTDPSGSVSLPPKQEYVVALSGVSAQGNPPTWQSSVCLCLALAESRRGMKGRLEEAVGVSSLQYVNSMQVLVDPWGTPIGFRRIPGPTTVIQFTGAGQTQQVTTAPGLNYEVFSAGPNRTAGDNDDLSSTRLRQAGARGD